MSNGIVSARFGVEGAHTLAAYEKASGYEAIRKALKEMSPEEVMGVVKAAGLRGRGGAGFPAGVKWGFVPKHSDKPKYLVVNADEGEPGTFKDRSILEDDPHLLIEGILLCCYAVGIHTAYIYIRGEFVLGAQRVEAALDEAYEAGLLGQDILDSGFSLDVHVHRGAGAYICGEETGLLESLEGKPGKPRLKPPFPAVVGAFGGPTVINNVETLSFLPSVIQNGAEWFVGLGSPKNSGTRIFCLSGHVEKPGLYERPMGTPFKDLLEAAGGVWKGRRLKAFYPGGSSSPVLTEEDIDVPMDFDNLAARGSMAGSGGVMVMDETVCMVRAAWRTARFYAHESCGQCTPCREGTGWLAATLWRLENRQGTPEDLDRVLHICDGMPGRTICVLSDAAAMPVSSLLQKFRHEFEEHLDLEGTCNGWGLP